MEGGRGGGGGAYRRTLPVDPRGRRPSGQQQHGNAVWAVIGCERGPGMMVVKTKGWRARSVLVSDKLLQDSGENYSGHENQS